MLTIADDDFQWFADHALDQAAAILRDLGDELANRTPDLPGANSPFAIVTHCLGVVELWAGHTALGRASTRDRPSEFVATGPVDDLLERIERAKAQLAEDVAAIGAAGGTAPPAVLDDPEDAALPLGRTQAGALIHILEELYQHVGQLELTRDVLRSVLRSDPRSDPQSR